MTQEVSLSWLDEYFTSEIGPALDIAGTGTMHNVNVRSSTVRMYRAARFTGVAPTVTGIISDGQARRVVLFAIGGPLVLANENSGSAPENRIVTGTGANATVAQGGAVLIVYDPPASRWRVQGGSGGGGLPGGSVGHVQVHDTGGVLGGSSKFVIDLTTGAITAAPGSGTPSYAFGALCSVGANLGALAGGYDSHALNNWCVALGAFNTVNVAGGTGLGETIDVQPGATNSSGIGFSITLTGQYAGALGVSLYPDGDNSFCSGVLAATRQTGERAHGSNLIGILVEKVWGGAGTGTAGTVNLKASDNTEFLTRTDAVHEMTIEVSGVSSSGTTGRSVRRVSAVNVGGTLTLNNAAVVTEAGQFPGNWTVTISQVGQIVRIQCNSGSDTVSFAARVTWTEQNIPAGGAFDPASVAWSMWYRAASGGEYDGAPWTPTASAGISGTNGNLTAPVAAPTVGTAQNGCPPAAHNGTTQYLRTANNINTAVSASAGTVSVLVKTPATSAAPAGAVIDDPCILSLDGSGFIGMGWNSSGIRFYAYDGAYKSIQIACSANAYHLLQMKWDGTNLKARVDSGAWQTIAVGALAGIGALLSTGTNYAYAQWAAMSLLELAVSASVLSDGTLDNYKTSLNTRYALSL